MKPGDKQNGNAERWEEWDPRRNVAVRELLDHLAHELAEEYIRLMKQAQTEEEES